MFSAMVESKAGGDSSSTVTTDGSHLTVVMQMEAYPETEKEASKGSSPSRGRL